MTLLLSGDARKALASFDQALVLDGKLAEARFNRGVALLQLGDYARATKELEQVWSDEKSPLRATAAYHVGLAHDRLGRTKDAESWLARALALDASLDAALLYTGLLRERRGDLQGAGRAYLDYLKRHPESLMARLRFGISAHQAGRPEVAKPYLDQVIKAAPDSHEAMEARKFLVMWE